MWDTLENMSTHFKSESTIEASGKLCEFLSKYPLTHSKSVRWHINFTFDDRKKESVHSSVELSET